MTKMSTQRNTAGWVTLVMSFVGYFLGAPDIFVYFMAMTAWINFCTADILKQLEK